MQDNERNSFPEIRVVAEVLEAEEEEEDEENNTLNSSISSIPSHIVDEIDQETVIDVKPIHHSSGDFIIVPSAQTETIPAGSEPETTSVKSRRNISKKILKEINTSYEASIYEDFDTIDWIRDSITDRMQRAQVDAKVKEASEKKRGLFIKIYQQFYRSQGWILVTLMAIIVGFLAGAIDVAVDFLADTRFGYCTKGVFLSRKLCCDDEPIETCAKWITWSAAFGVTNIKWSYFVNYMVYIIAAGIFAGLAAWYVKALARWASGSGIPEVKTILGGFVILKFASWQTLLVKVPGLVLSVSSGLNLGKEGPLVHVAACVCDFLSNAFPKYKHNQAKLREMYSAAAAAGVSVAFGAPIGGVLFSLEEVSYYFPHKTMWRAFFAASIAALVLQLMDPFHNGKLIIFQVNYTHSWLAFEFIAFILLGVIGGILGALFIKFNITMCKFRKSKLVNYSIIEAVCIACITALVSYSNDYLRGNASEIISELYAECTSSTNTPLCNLNTASTEIVILLFAAAIRLLLTIFTFGVKIPAGLFIPTLAVGASFGHAIGLLFAYIQNTFPNFFLFRECSSLSYCIDPGVYALIGSAAMLSGVTRMTVSLVVIMFEITGDVQYIVPIMITVMVAKWVGDGIGGDGIYDEHIILNEYPFLDNKASYRFSQVAKSMMKQNLFVLELRPYSVKELRKHISNSVYTGWPIVTDKTEMLVVGYIARSELQKALDIAEKNVIVHSRTLCYFTTSVSDTKPYIDLRPWMDSTPTQVTPRTPLNIIFDMFKKLGMRYILVSYRGRLVGIITKKDMLQHIAVHFHGKFRSFVIPESKDENPKENE